MGFCGADVCAYAFLQDAFILLASPIVAGACKLSAQQFHGSYSGKPTEKGSGFPSFFCYDICLLSYGAVECWCLKAAGHCMHAHLSS